MVFPVMRTLRVHSLNSRHVSRAAVHRVLTFCAADVPPAAAAAGFPTAQRGRGSQGCEAETMEGPI